MIKLPIDSHLFSPLRARDTGGTGAMADRETRTKPRKAACASIYIRPPSRPSGGGTSRSVRSGGDIAEIRLSNTRRTA
jgi:hypothetical protein